MTVARTWSTAVTSLVVGLVAVAAFAAPSAFALTTYTVSTTVDIAAGSGACGNASTTAPNPLSLREATCLANNVAGPVQINIPAGHYTLQNGELNVAPNGNKTVDLTGLAGAATTIIDGNNAGRVMEIDTSSAGGEHTTISGVTITNGRNPDYGGAGIASGSTFAASIDTLTLTNDVFSNNVNPTTNTASPGGAVGMYGGTLTVSNTVFSGNSGGSSSGSAVAYVVSSASVSGQTLQILNSTFAGNIVTPTASTLRVGGAIYTNVPGGFLGTSTIVHSIFTGNSSTATGTAVPVGGAVYSQGPGLQISRSTFTGNTTSGGGGGLAGAIWDENGALGLNYNRITGNTSTGGSAVAALVGNSVDATENFWGCNTGAVGAGCDTATGSGGTVTTAPYLKLTAAASPTTLSGPNATSTITGKFTVDSTGAAVSGTNLTAFDGYPATFSSPTPSGATLTSTSGTFASGVATTTYNSQSTSGAGGATVSFDNASATASLTTTIVDTTPPTVASVAVPANGSYKAGQALNFTVNWSEPVTVSTAGGTPTIPVTLDTGGTVQAAYVSGSGTSATTFRYTVGAGTTDSNGIVVGSAIALNGGGIIDAAGNAATLTLNSVASTTGVLVDTTAPTVSSIVRASASPTNATFVQFTVTFSESVTGVTTSSFTTVVVGPGGQSIAGVSGSGTTYTVTVNTGSGTGSLRLDANTNAGLDAAGNGSAAYSSGEVYNIDKSAPIVTGYTRTGTTPTNATTLPYALAFSESVTGVDVLDFSISATGTITYTSLTLTGSGNSYVVSLGGVAGTGTVHVDLKSSGTGIFDSVGNALASGATGGTYDVDTVAPTVTSIVRVGGSPTNAGTVQFTATFSEAVTGVDVSDFLATTTATASGVPSSVTGSGTTYTVTVGSVAGDGTLRLDLKSSGTGIQDGLGNAIAGGYTGGASYLIDTTAPSVSSVGVSADGTYVAGQVLDVTVTYDEPVAVTGGPSIGLELDSGTVAATYNAAASTATSVVFRYTVASGDIDADGIELATAIALNGGTVRDAAGNDAATSLGTVPSTAGVLVDAAAPGITSISVPAAGTHGLGANLDVTVSYDELVTVTGAPRVALTLDSGTAQAAYVSGSGTTTLTFRHVVATGDLDGDGIAVAGAIDLNGGTIADAAGNAAALDISTAGSTNGVFVDGVAPTVQSILQDGATPTNRASESWTVTFSEDVTGVDTVDFALASTGTVASTGLSLTGSGDTYVVTVAGLSGSGSLRLDLAATPSIVDAASNPVTAAYTSGETYVVDRDAPTVASVAVPAAGEYVAGDDLDVTVTFDSAVTVTGVPTLALDLDSEGVAADYVSGSGTTALVFRYEVAAGDLDTDGFDIGPISLGGGTIRDSVDNDAVLTLPTTSAPAGVQVDAVAPTVSSIVRVGSSPTNAGSLAYTITFSEAVTGFDVSDLTVTATGTAASTGLTLTGSGSTFTATLAGVTGDGTLRLDLAAGAGITDAVGNALVGAYTSGETYTLDHVAPTTTLTAHPAAVSNSSDATFSFTSNETGRFECDLDGAGYATCTPGLTYTGLDDGPHTFAVRAVDEAGNADATPETFAWSIDTGAPDTTIATHPAAFSTVTSPAFTLTSDEGGTITYACTLDGAAQPCSASFTVGPLTDGAHTLTAAATDASNNTDATPASFTWTVDTAAPDTSISGAPTAPTTDTSATLTLASTEPTGATFACTVDGVARACATSFPVSGLSLGSHTVTAAAVDRAGNVDATPASVTWIVVAPPVTPVPNPTPTPTPTTTPVDPTPTVLRAAITPAAFPKDTPSAVPTNHVVTLGAAACGSDEAACTVTAKLQSVTKHKIPHAKLHLLVFGTATFRVTGGTAVPIKIKLTKAGLDVLKRYPSVKSVAVIQVRDTSGNLRTFTVKVTLKAPKAAAKQG